MPTPRQHGGTSLAKIPFVVPGFNGLNTARKSGTLGPEWASKLVNSVLDNNGRVAARLGWDSITTTPAAEDFIQLFSYLTHAGTERYIAASSASLFSSTDGGATWTDRTGALTPADGNWQFVNFNDAVYGIQQGEDVIKATSGDFATVSGTNVPSGNCMASAYGRLWAADSNGTDLRYSALLDGDDWDGADAGVFDLTNVWPGTDTITAISSFNGRLIVFGSRNIVMYHDPTGTALGIDPTQMEVADIVTGTGCIARDSVQAINSDLWFLSNVGLQSLGSLILQKTSPINNLSLNVSDEISRRITAADSVIGTTRSVYSPRDKLYLLSIPALEGLGGVVAFDTRSVLSDGSARCVGLWEMYPTAMSLLANYSIAMAIEGVTGEVGIYRGATDNGSTYVFTYESGWLDLTQQGYLLLPKRYSGTFYTDTTVSVSFRWAFDFSESYKTSSVTFVAGSARPEFGVAEFGIAEFGGGVALRSGKVPGNGSGEFIKLGISLDVTGTSFSIQQLNLFSKIGRYA